MSFETNRLQITYPHDRPFGTGNDHIGPSASISNEFSVGRLPERRKVFHVKLRSGFSDRHGPVEWKYVLDESIVTFG
jgi:hypothetical protein